MSRSTRGASLAAVIMALAGLTAAVAIGFSMRTSELRFRDRSACRVAARWAAESAIARGRTRGSNLSGELDGATYSLMVERVAGGRRLVGTGTCVMGSHTSRIEIVETFDGGRLVGHAERGVR